MSGISGIRVDQSVVAIYEKLKTTKVLGSGVREYKYDYVFCKIEGNKVVVGEAPEYGDTVAQNGGVKKENGVPVEYTRLKKLMEMAQCGYAFYDFQWKQSDGDRDSIVFITYCDDNAPSTLKMPYSTTKGSVEKKCPGAAKVEANDKEELDYFNIVEQISNGKAIREQ